MSESLQPNPEELTSQQFTRPELRSVPDIAETQAATVTIEREKRPYEDSAEIYDLLYSGKQYAREAALLRKQLDPPIEGEKRDLLEIACGTGKYLDEFKDDFNIAGLDLSPEQLAVAREKFPDTPLYQGDMTNFSVDKEYDTVMCLFSSIGCVETPDRLKSAVASMARAVKPGGQIIIEPWVFQGELQGTPSTVHAEGDGVDVTRVNTVTKETITEADGSTREVSHVHMDYTVKRGEDEETYSETMSMGLFTPEQYKEALHDAGITDIVLHRDGLADEEGMLFKRGLFVGRKPEELEAAA